MSYIFFHLQLPNFEVIHQLRALIKNYKSKNNGINIKFNGQSFSLLKIVIFKIKININIHVYIERLNCIISLYIGKFDNIKLLKFQMPLNAFPTGVLSCIHFSTTPSALTLQFYCSCFPIPF